MAIIFIILIKIIKLFLNVTIITIKLNKNVLQTLTLTNQLLINLNFLLLELLCKKLEADAKLNAEARACTGSLASHPRSRDIKIDNLSISFHGCELLQDTMLELNCGRRYGLIGLNGSGKRLFCQK